ncbi:hypothetical protein DYB35_009647 [Aphanomyces astaci]|uniref:Uncharacterized protein n=1 Tax=Aphanomyces astaci TaxID=112090 RepID=A0A418DG15_APHAT|nr:hypothetical protein DYB35_009647 [Aphanomyces astaci]
MVQDMASRLKQKHMDIEAVGCLEQGLWLKWRLLGPQHADVHRSLQEVVALYNQHAMEQLSANDVDRCLELLQKADRLASSDKFTYTESLRILTYNNLGCCYRRLNKLPKALKYLDAAAAIGAETTHVKNLSITYLNLCAIHSQMGRHDTALEHAQSAIFHAQEELVVEKVEADDDETKDLLDTTTTTEEKIVGLAIAYHNMGVELEHNEKADASLQVRKKALQLIFKYKTSNPELWHTFKATFDAAKQATASALHNTDHSSRLPLSIATSPPKRTPISTLPSRAPPSKLHRTRPPTAKPVDPPKIAPTFAHLRPKSARPSQRLRHAVQASRSPVNNDDDDVVEVFDDDEDEEDVLQVFDTVQRVDVRRPIKPTPPVPCTFDAVAVVKEDVPVVVPERVSHVAYLKQLRHSIDSNVSPTACVDITRRHKLAMDVQRVRRVASVRLQALCRGHLVRLRSAVAQKQRDAQHAKELEAARQLQARLRGGGDRHLCLMTTRMDMEVARIHATAATRMQAVWRGSRKRRRRCTHEQPTSWGLDLARSRTTGQSQVMDDRADVESTTALATTGDITTDKAKVALERRRLLDATVQRERLRQEASRLEAERKQVEEATKAETTRLELEAIKLEADKRKLRELAERQREEATRQAQARRQLEEAARADESARQREIELEIAKFEALRKETARLEEERLRQAKAYAEAEQRRLAELARLEAERRVTLEGEMKREQEERRLGEATAKAKAEADEAEQRRRQLDKVMKAEQLEAQRLLVELAAIAEVERIRELEARTLEMEREHRDGAVKVEAAAAAAVRQEADRRRQEEVANAEQSRLNQVAAELEAERLSQEAKAKEVVGRQEAAKAEMLWLNEAEKLQAERLRLDQLLAKGEADQVRLNKLANEEIWHQDATIIIEASRQQTIDLDKVAKAETDRIRQATKVEAERLEREAERCRGFTRELRCERLRWCNSHANCVAATLSNFT